MKTHKSKQQEPKESAKVYVQEGAPQEVRPNVNMTMPKHEGEPEPPQEPELKDSEPETPAAESWPEQMNEEDIRFIKDNQHIHDGFVTGQGSYIDSTSAHRSLSLIRKFNPEYDVNMACGDCIVTMIKDLYRFAHNQPQYQHTSTI